jgi:hypothetical protein
LVLTETWFNDSNIYDIEGYVGYHVYRQASKGGGVSIYVSTNLKSDLISELSFIGDTFEICSVKVIICNDVYFNVVGLYRPPRDHISQFNSIFFDILETNFSQSSNVVLLGDF